MRGMMRGNHNRNFKIPLNIIPPHHYNHDPHHYERLQRIQTARSSLFESHCVTSSPTIIIIIIIIIQQNH